LFNYNYWSSPVSRNTNGTNNNGYSISGLLKEGTLVTNPLDLLFTPSSVGNAAPGTG
jgi:hypothetical protein